MEYVEGQRLDERIAGRPLPISELIQIGTQIADALDEAHEQGIIHRDIKSQNVMLSTRGRVKVLDFGIAKLSQVSGAADSEADTRVKTKPGVVMGTVSYMSPEQALGREIDARADVWSLGVVLYEMATGRLPFVAASLTETIDRIAHSQPEAVARHNYEVPPELEIIIKKTLRKNREERYATARDLLVDLKALARELDLTEQPLKSRSDAFLTSESANTLALKQTTAEATTVQRTSSAEYLVTEIKRHKIAAVIASVILITIVGALGYWLIQNRRSQSAQSAGAGINFKIQRLTGNGKVSLAAISPDGKFLAFVQNEGGNQGLWVKQISTNSNVQIVAPGSINRYSDLCFTPDGSYVYFNGTDQESSGTSIFRVPTLGGTFSKIIPNAFSPSFAPDGKQVVYGRWQASTTETALFTANMDGSGERKLTSFYKNIYLPGTMAWSPDGKSIACAIGNDDKPDHTLTLAVISVADGSLKELSDYKWDEIDSVVWLPNMTGLIFSADDSGGGEGTSKLWELSYPGGESRRLTQDLTDYSRISLTADGKALVAIEHQHTSSVWVSPNTDPNRAVQITSGKDTASNGIAWTPDKRIVYVSIATGNKELWIVNPDGPNQKQLTNDGRIKYTPVVSPDGRYIVYATSQGDEDLWRLNIDGSNPTLITTSKNVDEGNPDISPDSRWVVYSAWIAGQLNLWRVSIEGGEPQRLTNTHTTEPQISPDGKFIAFFFNDDKNVVHLGVIPFDGGAPVHSFAVPQTTSVDLSPKWTPDGLGITYIDNRGGTQNLWLQPLSGGPAKQLTDFKQGGIYRREWSRDGKQIAIVRGESTNDVVMITDFK